MDPDPELDVTLSNGRRVVTFQISALDRDLGTWTVGEPFVPRRVILGDAEALALRRRVDARIAARLAAGWSPWTEAQQACRRPPYPRTSRCR